MNMGHHKSVIKRKERRRNRSKKTSFGHPNRYRLVIYRSTRNIEVQVINDLKGHTIVSSSSRDKEIRSSAKGTDSKTDFSKKEECKLKRKVCLKRKNLPDEPDITCDIQEECSNYSDKGACNKQKDCEWRK